MGTRKVMADFDEGVFGIVLNWPQMVAEGDTIEVVLPERKGRMTGRPLTPENDPAINVVITNSAFQSQTLGLIRHLIREQVTFSTEHLKDGENQGMLWTFSTGTSLPLA